VNFLEYIAVYIVLFIVYGLFFWDSIPLSNIFIISIFTTTWFKHLIEIIKNDRTGGSIKNLTIYDEIPNQPLAIAVFVVLTIGVLFAHYSLYLQVVNGVWSL